MLSVGGLFSGIGGWELGLERAGMRVAWHCEADPYCRAVLEHHWPDVPCYPDVRELRGADVEPVDVLCGGFPCQDISSAGAKVGIGGARSGLWSEYARLIGELRPRYVLVENVSALLTRGLGTVLADLSALGMSAEWDCLPAAAFGAPHRRDRLWLVGYPNDEGQPALAVDDEASGVSQLGDPDPFRRAGRAGELGPAGRGEPSDSGWWPPEPDVDRVAHGVPNGMDRLTALGNALCPPIAQWIGERVVAYEEGRLAHAA